MGDWLSWLERLVHTEEVTGSSPVSPTVYNRDSDVNTKNPPEPRSAQAAMVRAELQPQKGSKIMSHENTELTFRDRAAIHALQGLLAANAAAAFANQNASAATRPTDFARIAFDMAEALKAEREIRNRTNIKPPKHLSEMRDEAVTASKINLHNE
jgi:hypothetical protein